MSSCFQKKNVFKNFSIGGPHIWREPWPGAPYLTTMPSLKKTFTPGEKIKIDLVGRWKGILLQMRDQKDEVIGKFKNWDAKVRPYKNCNSEKLKNIFSGQIF